PMHDAAGNFPMIGDEANQRVIVVFRNPARLEVFAMTNGEKIAERDTCGDSDDVFMDARRKRVYVSCGEGAIDVFDAEGTSYRRLPRIPTGPGGRPSLFFPTQGPPGLSVAAQREETGARVGAPGG